MVKYNIDLNDKVVLVTGAAGFIGANLVKRLLNEFDGVKVIGIDSITDYYDVRLKYERLEELGKYGNRFVFVKDISCDINIIHQRLQQLKNSKIKIYNANAQTLLASLQAGAAGYSGVMANFHPQLYVYLCEHFETEPEKAELLQAFLCTTSGFAENSTPYPLSAKYHMRFEGIPTVNYARNRNSEELTDYMKDCTKQMHTLCEYFYKQL